MRTLKISFQILLFILVAHSAQAQTQNWAGAPGDYRHFFRASFGLEQGVVLGLGYGYKLDMGPIPVILTAQYSMPAGGHFTDDFKVRTGVQIRWFESGNVHFSTNIDGVFRRFENDYARIANFGCDVAGILGYYRPHWYLAGEARFDKAIVSHFKHSATYRESFPEVGDGWYEPPTGGNFFYGLQAGVSFGKQDLYLRAGKVLAEDFKTVPMLPFYGQVGYNLRI